MDYAILLSIEEAEFFIFSQIVHSASAHQEKQNLVVRFAVELLVDAVLIAQSASPFGEPTSTPFSANVFP